MACVFMPDVNCARYSWLILSIAVMAVAVTTGKIIAESNVPYSTSYMFALI